VPGALRNTKPHRELPDGAFVFSEPSGHDAHHRYVAYEQRETARSKHELAILDGSSAPTRVPVSRSVTITQNRGHVCDSVGGLFYNTPISGVLGAAPKDKPIKLFWRSRQVPTSYGPMVELPAGKIAVNRMELGRDGSAQAVFYRYKIIDASETDRKVMSAP